MESLRSLIIKLFPSSIQSIHTSSLHIMSFIMPSIMSALISQETGISASHFSKGGIISVLAELTASTFAAREVYLKDPSVNQHRIKFFKLCREARPLIREDVFKTPYEGNKLQDPLKVGEDLDATEIFELYGRDVRSRVGENSAEWTNLSGWLTDLEKDLGIVSADNKTRILHAIFAFNRQQYRIGLGVYAELLRLIAGETKYKKK